MTTKQKAQDIVNNFKKHANGYVGSSMLTNTEFPESKLNHAREIAKDVVREILEALKERDCRYNFYAEQTRFYNQVLIDIDETE